MSGLDAKRYVEETAHFLGQAIGQNPGLRDALPMYALFSVLTDDGVFEHHAHKVALADDPVAESERRAARYGRRGSAVNTATSELLLRFAARCRQGESGWAALSEATAFICGQPDSRLELRISDSSIGVESETKLASRRRLPKRGSAHDLPKAFVEAAVMLTRRGPQPRRCLNVYCPGERGMVGEADGPYCVTCRHLPHKARQEQLDGFAREIVALLRRRGVADPPDSRAARRRAA